MRGSARSMTVLPARSPREALSALAKRPDALPLAGGTDVMVGWNAGGLNGKTILDLSGVRAWKPIRRKGDSLLVGALATHTELQGNALVRAHFPLLARACSMIGAVAIQNRGTLGGNIANASPAGDTFPPLAVYGATVHLVSLNRRRSLPIGAVFAGVKRTHLEPGELIESIELPLPKEPPTRSYFRKVGTRAAQALSKTVAAGVLWLGREGRVKEMRFALGSMAPTVRRLATAEQFLKGQKLTPPVIDRACEMAAQDVAPIDDVRSTAEYRLAVSRNMLREFLESEHDR